MQEWRWLPAQVAALVMGLAASSVGRSAIGLGRLERVRERECVGNGLGRERDCVRHRRRRVMRVKPITP